MSERTAQLDPVRAARVLMALDEFLPIELKQSDSTLPKYVRLENALVRAIEAGVMVEGDKLPSEAELTAISSFSLGTVQKALRSMVDAGRIVRKTGVGTTIQTNAKSMRHPLHARFSRHDGPFFPVFARIIGRENEQGQGPWTDVLGDDAAIIRLDRRLEIGREFVAVSNFYVDAAKFPFFKDRPVNQFATENFKLLVENETGRKVRRLDHKITWSKAKPEVSGHIGVETGDQILEIKLSAWDRSNDPLYYQILHIPPNELDLTIESLV